MYWNTYSASAPELALWMFMNLGKDEVLMVTWTYLPFFFNLLSKIDSLAFDWLTHILLLFYCYRYMDFNKTWLKASTSYPLTSPSFSNQQNGCPGFWIAQTFLLFYNCCTDKFKKTCQKGSTLHDFQICVCCISGQSLNKDGRHGFWLAFPLQPLQ